MAFRQLIGKLALAATALSAAQGFAAPETSGAAVRAAIDRGVRYLKSQQSDGSWAGGEYPGGYTCLATLALLTAGEPADSPAMKSALRRVKLQRNAHVYVASLKISALALADAREYERQIEAAARWLMQMQNDDGLWGYDAQRREFDHSNAQFALLGLNAAAGAGVHVPDGVWARARTRVIATQNPDGGWGYKPGQASTGSMTAAGASDLIILDRTAIAASEEGFEGGAAPHCGEYLANRPLINGLNWLGRQFSAAENPAGERQYLYYWLYAIERVGILAERQSFGAHDWYREGVQFLLSAQKPDGRWGGGVVDTSFALLFLAKGARPLLMQKLQWARDDAWNLDRNDLRHLVEFAAAALQRPLDGRSVPFDAPLEDWLAAPLLYMQGHTFPDWSGAERAKVRRYVGQGGTLLAEACCGRSEFRAGFLAFAKATFPEYPLRELEPGHLLYAAHFPTEPAGLWGIDVGCRTSVLFSPSDLSCLWEQKTLGPQSDRALRLGVNVAAFAMGRRALQDRLEVVITPEVSAPAAPPPGDALRLAQVAYRGDWRPDPDALKHFAAFLRTDVGLNVAEQPAAVRLADDDLRAAPVLYMTGHYAFHLSPREAGALAAHLRRGGFLLADACCGRAEFDESFRRMAREAFPDAPLERLAPTHPIFSGDLGFALERVKYKEAALRERPDLGAPELWGVTIAGRCVLAYSPYALGCGLDGHACYHCRGLLDEDARRLAANAVVYALTR